MNNGKECLTSSFKHIHMQAGTFIEGTHTINIRDLHTEQLLLVGVTRIISTHSLL